MEDFASKPLQLFDSIFRHVEGYEGLVIDRYLGPVIVDLTALAFCDARGLAALVRMAGYAKQKGCPFGVASPSPSLVKIMRITGLDRRFLASRVSALSQVQPN